MQAIIIEDEPFVREDLKQMLKHHDDIELIGEAGTVPRALKLLAQKAPDVVFLDIQLVGGTGFDLVPAVPPSAKIIFFTSHDAFAVRAFEVNALDYLLKPVTRERLEASLNRLRKKAANPSLKASSSTAYTEEDRIFLYSSKEQRFAPVRDMAAVTAMGGNYTLVHIGDGTRTAVRRTMKQWENLLPDTLFFRAHRASLINLDLIQALRQEGGHVWKLYMKGLKDPLEVSRRSLALLKDRLKNRA